MDSELGDLGNFMFWPYLIEVLLVVKGRHKLEKKFIDSVILNEFSKIKFRKHKKICYLLGSCRPPSTVFSLNKCLIQKEAGILVLWFATGWPLSLFSDKQLVAGLLRSGPFSPKHWLARCGFKKGPCSMSSDVSRCLVVPKMLFIFFSLFEDLLGCFRILTLFSKDNFLN